MPKLRALFHRGDEHKRTGILNRISGTADSDFAVFKGLSQHFERALVELGELITKEDPIMGHTDFPRQGSVATSRHRHLRHGMMRTAEGAL